MQLHDQKAETPPPTARCPIERLFQSGNAKSGDARVPLCRSDDLERIQGNNGESFKFFAQTPKASAGRAPEFTLTSMSSKSKASPFDPPGWKIWPKKKQKKNKGVKKKRKKLHKLLTFLKQHRSKKRNQLPSTTCPPHRHVMSFTGLPTRASAILQAQLI